MYYKYIKNDSKINLSDEYETLKKAFESGGVLYRKNTEPVKIEPTRSKLLVPASDRETFYSGGEIVFKVVDEGTLLVNGVFPVTSEELLEQYEQCTDQFGNAIEGMYIKINEALIIKNPFDKPIVKVNPKGYVFEEGSSDCFIATDSSSGELDYIFLTEEQLNNRYRKIDVKQLTKNK